ncbi:MAG: PhzF family phenazine biosynthesis protein [Holosporales bacterium]|jgi:predicted PhzF superfamily epimerase YddE/YHI9|nr:PhzF family phenazine biosynthesis protein [Holosporales bacterium]
MSVDFCIVDTFSSSPLAGGASAVLFVDDDVFVNGELMQNIAMELNTPETTFIKKNGASDFNIVCYTPIRKEMLFGNGLFAASHILSVEQNNSDPINFLFEDRIFETKTDDGVTSVRLSSTNFSKIPMSDSISSAFSGEIIVSVAESGCYLIVEIRSPGKLAKLDPNIDILSHIDHEVVIVTSDNHYEKDTRSDYYARVFAPKLGVFEDNITPLAHARLASYWSERFESNKLTGCQNSKKECYIDIEILPDEKHMYISGKNTIVTKGTLFL